MRESLIQPSMMMKNEVAGSPWRNSTLLGRRLTTLACASRTPSTSDFNPKNTGIWDAMARSAGDGAVMFLSLKVTSRPVLQMSYRRLKRRPRTEGVPEARVTAHHMFAGSVGGHMH